MAAHRTSERFLPHYLRIAAELREAIIAGQYAPGASIPSESSLRKRYDVSRFTVRAALKQLQLEGLIAVKRGARAIVQPSRATIGTLRQPLTNLGELFLYGKHSKVDFVEGDSGVLPKHLSDQIAHDTIGNWRSFRGTRFNPDNDQPIAITDTYFRDILGTAVDKLDLEAGALFSQIEKICGISIGRVTQDISADNADETIAQSLKIEPGGAILRIMRCYIEPGGMVYQISVSSHPGGRFEYTMNIDPE